MTASRVKSSNSKAQIIIGVAIGWSFLLAFVWLSRQVRQDEKIEFESEYFDKSINGINATILNTSNKHPAMIGIGSVHTATSSVHYLLCGKHEDTRCPSHCFECGRYTQEFYFKYMEKHYSIPRQYRMWERSQNKNRFIYRHGKNQSNVTENKLMPFPVINYKTVEKGMQNLSNSKLFDGLNSLYTKLAKKFVKQNFVEKDVDVYFQDLKNIVNKSFDNKKNLYKMVWFIQFESLFSDNYRFDLERLHQAFPTIRDFMKIWSHSIDVLVPKQNKTYVYTQRIQRLKKHTNKSKNKNKKKKNNYNYDITHMDDTVHRVHGNHAGLLHMQGINILHGSRSRRSLRAKSIAIMNQPWSKLYLSPKYYYFVKTTSYYYSPHTAYIFAFEFALPYGTKFIWNIRDPVKRIWSLKQHWYKSHKHVHINGTKSGNIGNSGNSENTSLRFRGNHNYKNMNQMHGESAQIDLLKHYFGNYKDKFEIEWVRFLFVMSFIENENILSNRDMAVIYLNFYYGTYAKYCAQDFIASMYCYQLSFWLQYFDAAFGSTSSNSGDSGRSSENYFKIWQTSFVVADLSKSINLIYCWLKYDISNYNKDWKRCESVLKATGEYQTNLSIKAASRHRWNWPMDDKNTKFWANLFKSCNSRVDNIVAKRPNLVLGEWNSWNTKYFEN